VTLQLQILGKIPELANHHSASRVIQWCLKYATEADKADLLGEIRTAAVPLAKSKYGRFVVQKLISVASKEEVPGRPMHTQFKHCSGWLLSAESSLFLGGSELLQLLCFAHQ
jgi:hypothetical protein